MWLCGIVRCLRIDRLGYIYSNDPDKHWTNVSPEIEVMKKFIVLSFAVGFLGLAPSLKADRPTGLANGGPLWSGPIIATGENRVEIKSLPIESRPNRPLHIYGNTVRRASSRQASPIMSEPVPRFGAIRQPRMGAW